VSRYGAVNRASDEEEARALGGNGYSYGVEVTVKGVPTMLVDGE